MFVTTKMLEFPRSQVNTSEGMGITIEGIWKSTEGKEQAGLHLIQCSDEAPVGRLKNSQVNLT